MAGTPSLRSLAAAAFAEVSEEVNSIPPDTMNQSAPITSLVPSLDHEEPFRRPMSAQPRSAAVAFIDQRDILFRHANPTITPPSVTPSAVDIKLNQSGSSTPGKDPFAGLEGILNNNNTSAGSAGTTTNSRRSSIMSRIPLLPTRVLRDKLFSLYEALGVMSRLHVADKDKRYFVDVFNKAKQRNHSVDPMVKKMAMKEISNMEEERGRVMAVITAIRGREHELDALHDTVAQYERQPKFFNAGFCGALMSDHLERMRTRSVAVVEAVNEWRKGLPAQFTDSGALQPFIFRGVNYVQKMQTDLNFLLISPVSKFVALDVHNNIQLQPRRRKIDVVHSELDVRKRNFFARLSAPHATLPVRRAAGALDRSAGNLAAMQLATEKERKNNAWFAAATAEVANVEMNADAAGFPEFNAVAQDRSELRMMRRCPYDRFASVKPARPRSAALKRYAKAALEASHRECDEALGVVITGEVRSIDGDVCLAVRKKQARANAQYMWSMVFYICMMVGARRRLLNVVRRRRAAKRIQRFVRMWLGTMQYRQHLNWLIPKWEQHPPMFYIKHPVSRLWSHIQISSIRIQRAFRRHRLRVQWRIIIQRYSQLQRLQVYWRCHRRVVQFKQNLLVAKCARRILQFYIERLRLRALRIRNREWRSAIRLQRGWRCYNARVTLEIKRRRNRAATKIQANVRGWRARRYTQLLRNLLVIKRFVYAQGWAVKALKFQARKILASGCIQRIWRVSQAKELFKLKQQQRRAQLRTFLRVDLACVERAAAEKIFAFMLMSKARQKFFAEKQRLQMKIEKESAKLGRRLVGDKTPLVAWLAYQQYQKEIEPSVIRIQRCWNAHYLRVYAKYLKQIFRLRQCWFSLWRCNVTFRRHFRDHCSQVGKERFIRLRDRIRSKHETRRLQIEHTIATARVRRTAAAVLIQSTYRRYLTRCAFLAALPQFEAHLAQIAMQQRREDAARTLQKGLRQYVLRRKAATLRLARQRNAAIRISRFGKRLLDEKRRIDSLIEEHRLRVVSAFKIQTAWRFYLIVRHEREMSSTTDDEPQIHFF